MFRPLNFQKCAEHADTCGVLYILTWKCGSRHSGAHFFNIKTSIRATAAHTFSTSKLPKMFRTPQFLTLLTWKRASRHNRVHSFFDIWTSKSGLRTENGVFCTFWLGESWRCASRPTTACNFSSLIWPAGSAPAALASLLFDPPEPQIIGKTWVNTANRDFPTYSRTCIIFLPTLSLLWSSHFLASPLWLFSPLLFHLSEVWLLNFLWQLQLHYTTLHHTTSSSRGFCDHCNHSKKHNSNQLSVQQWIRSASHQCITTTHLSYSFLSLKLPPPPLRYY